MRWRETVFLVATALLGCGDDPALPDMLVRLTANWPWPVATREALGYEISAFVTQRRFNGGPCQKLPTDARVTIDGEEARLSRDPATGCLDVEVTKGPLLDRRDDPVTVRYEERGRQIAEAVFDKLTPGGRATLVMPSDGIARAGDQILIVPPPELPSSMPGSVRFYPLDAEATATWDPRGVRVAATRLPDGIHTTAPQMLGRAVAVLDGTPIWPEPVFTCEGFASCDGTGTGTLGPFLLTVQP